MILELDNTLKRVSIKMPSGTNFSQFMETLTLLDLEQLEDWTIDIQYIPIYVNSTGITYSTGVPFTYTKK